MKRPSNSVRAPGLIRAAAAGLLALGAVGAAVAAPEREARAPNIVFLLADDLGYGDLGSYGQQDIRTPNLDRMARDGMRFLRHYAGSPVCAPSRGVLLTGLHPGHAHVRNNRTIEPEGQEPLPADAVTLPQLLQQQGYATGAFGKWGLGGPGSSGDPLRQGFDRFFGYLCQREAHNYYPTYLWNNDKRTALDNPAFSSRQAFPEGLDPSWPENYAQYSGSEYAPDLYTEQALDFIREQRARPFFLYYATTVPHVALQVPEDSLAEYLGRWPETPYPGDKAYLPHFAPKAAYAAMITRMDRDIGRIVALVEELGLGEETLFVFTSDNGAVDDAGGAELEYFDSNGPLRSGKRWLYEGGIRVPLIVRWTGVVKPGSVSARVTGFEDWLPTLLAAAGAGQRVPEHVDGISFLPALRGERQEKRPFLYREFPAFGGQQAVWWGNWKGMRMNLLRNPPDSRIELYHLGRDPGEEHDVAAQHPDVVQRIAEIMQREHRPSGLFPIPALDDSEFRFGVEARLPHRADPSE